MHVHVAPYFYWFSGIILGLSKLSPIGWSVSAAFIAVTTMIVMVKVGTEFFGKRVTLIALILYAFSFYQNIFDRHYWGLVFNGLVALLSLWCLHRILSGKQKYLYVLAAVLAFGFHTDLSTLTLCILTTLTFLFYKPNISKRVIAIAVGIFLLSFVPLVIFDIRHSFSNSRGIFQYFTEVREEKLKTVNQNLSQLFFFPAQTLTRLLYTFGNQELSYQYSYCPVHQLGRVNAVPTVISSGIVLYIFWLAHKTYVERKKKEVLGRSLILILTVSTYVGIFIYGFIFHSNVFDHYLSTLFPPFILLISWGIGELWKKSRKLAVGLVSIIVILNLHSLYAAEHQFGFINKEKAIKWAIATAGNRDFSLDVLGSCFRYNGYRYLFYLFGKEPVKSYVDTNFTHLYDAPPAIDHPHLLIVITNPDIQETPDYIREYQAYLEQTIARAYFGKIEVLVVDNSNLRFVGKF